MSKTLSQIYSEAIQKRNDYLQITELNSGLTKSKMSILNLLTYVMSVLIHSYNVLLDVFEVNIANLISNRINGTAQWYAIMATKFQFNSLTRNCDPLIFDEETLKIRYEKVDTSHQIIAKASYVANEAGDGIILKVCKDNTNSDEKQKGVNYTQLDNDELTAFKFYINQIKFVGANIQTLTLPGDIIIIKNCVIVYDDKYITEEQAFDNIKKSLINYASTLDYNAFIYSQKIIDAIMSSDYIENVNSCSILVKKYNLTKKTYDAETEINNMQRAYSGYVKFIDENGDSTIKTANITFKKMSDAQ